MPKIDEAMAALDVTGQPGGPSPEEQAQVDAAQRDLMAQMAKDREPEEIAARIAMQKKVQEAQAALANHRDLVETVRAMDARLKILEAKNGA